MELFRQELTRLIPQLRRYAYALVNQADTADDLVQDCLERALTRHHLWDPSRPMKPWLMTLLHNIYANKARKYHRSPGLISIDDTEELADNSNTSELSLRELQHSLDQLSEEHRQVILLTGLEQMSYKETATILDIPVGTLMSRLSRARNNLRQIMNEHSSIRGNQ